MTTKTKAIKEYGRRAFLNVSGCPYEHPECHGVSGLYFGLLSCFQCWMDAPLSAHETMAEWGA